MLTGIGNFVETLKRREAAKKGGCEPVVFLWCGHAVTVEFWQHHDSSLSSMDNDQGAEHRIGSQLLKVVGKGQGGEASGHKPLGSKGELEELHDENDNLENAGRTFILGDAGRLVTALMGCFLGPINESHAGIRERVEWWGKVKAGHLGLTGALQGVGHGEVVQFNSRHFDRGGGRGVNRDVDILVVGKVVKQRESVIAGHVAENTLLGGISGARSRSGCARHDGDNE